MACISRENFDRYSTKVKLDENFAQILIRIDSGQCLKKLRQ